MRWKNLSLSRMKSSTGKGKKKGGAPATESTEEHASAMSDSTSGQQEPTVEAEVNWEQKLKDSEYKYLQLYAEFDNFRKRTAKERQELIQTAAAPLFKAILPSLDNLERALKNMRDSGAREEDIKGIELIQQQLLRDLAERGLEVMDVVGQDFNPDEHEAITQVPGGPEMKNKIIDVLEKGYTIHGKIVRYARVVVGS
jgi:molecular chaperone GrpE